MQPAPGPDLAEPAYNAKQFQNNAPRTAVAAVKSPHGKRVGKQVGGKSGSGFAGAGQRKTRGAIDTRPIGHPAEKGSTLSFTLAGAARSAVEPGPAISGSTDPRPL